MSFSIATWNINSVRLRIGLVTRFLEQWKPDVLCLQETKCPQGQFPSGPLKDMGYGHIAEYGQSGYHGVAIVSRLPIDTAPSRSFCGKADCRHVSAAVGGGKPITIHNLYVPAGGDEPDPAINEKFDHKLKFIAELEAWFGAGSVPKGHEGIVVGDLNVAPLEDDVWSHKQLLKIVSHTPVETNGLKRVQAAGAWVDLMRQHAPPPEKLYTWWSYRAKDWLAADRGRRLDHIWSTKGLAGRLRRIDIFKEARGWPQPSDHVPVIAAFDLPA
jgi:exodeoxyribonuclease III